MAYDLGTLLDVAPEKDKTEQSEQKNEQTSEVATQPANKRADLIEESAKIASEQEKNNTSTPITSQDIAVAGGAGAGAYAANKLNARTMLSPEVRSSAINLRNSNQQLKAAQEAHAPNAFELEEAQRGHEYWNSPEAIEKHINPEDMPKPPIEPEPTIEVKQKPIGGEGSAHHAMKFGATETEALNAPSMSYGQKVIVPKIEEGVAKAKQVGIGQPFAVEGSQLVVGNSPEAQKALKEHALELKKKELEAQNAPKKALTLEQEAYNAKMEELRAEAEKKIAPHKEAAAKRLEEAKQRFDETKQALEDAAQKQSQRAATLNNRTSSMNPNLVRQAENLSSKGSMMGNIIDMGGRLIRKVATPALVASIPYEVSEARKAYNENDYKNAIKHGLGAASGALQLAPAGALALGLAPEAAGTAAVVGGLTGLGLLGHDVYENYPRIKNYVVKKTNDLLGD
jgi:hypothetical protein